MADEYHTLYDTFRWHVPRDFNISKNCCFDWAHRFGHRQKLALRWQRPHHADQSISYGKLGSLVCQLSNGLLKLGVIPGDRVIVLMRCPIEALAVMMACWATAAVAVPLIASEDEDALVLKLKQARGRLIFIDHLTENVALAAIARCPRIKQVVGYDVSLGSVMSWRGLVARQPEHFQTVAALPSAPALMIWPASNQHLFPADTAFILPQQALIGSLPGFVASNNWFPAHASALQTTLMPWFDAGLMAAILPALYFGSTVILDQSPTLLLSPETSHLLTTPTRWCKWLKTADPGQSRPLQSVALLGDQFADHWRELSQARTGQPPNLSIYIPGCGLVLGQSNNKWPTLGLNDVLVMPGYQVQVNPCPTSRPTGTGNLGFLSIARTDINGHTNPAQYTQAWPQKDSLNSQGLGADALWLESDLLAHAVARHQWVLHGCTDQTLRIEQGIFNASQLEQQILQIPEVWSVAVIVSSHKKGIATNTIVVLLQVTPETQTKQLNWRHDISQQVRGSILALTGSSFEQTTKPPLVKVGLVSSIEYDHMDQPERQAWAKRLKPATIDFLPSAPTTRSPR